MRVNQLLDGSALMLARASETFGRAVTISASTMSFPSGPVRTAMFPPGPKRTLILRRRAWTVIFAVADALIAPGTSSSPCWAKSSLERNKPWQSQILPQPEIYAAICRYALPWSLAAPCLVDMHECCQKERRTSAFANSQDSAHVPRLWRLFVPWGSVMRMTRGCAGVVDASPQSFGG